MPHPLNLISRLSFAAVTGMSESYRRLSSPPG